MGDQLFRQSAASPRRLCVNCAYIPVCLVVFNGVFGAWGGTAYLMLSVVGQSGPALSYTFG